MDVFIRNLSSTCKRFRVT